MDPITWVPLIVGAAVKGPEIIRFGREIINTKKSLDEVRLYQLRCDTYLREVKAENDELRREGRIPPALRNETRNLIRYCRGMVNGVAQYHDDYVHRLSIRLLHIFAMPVRNQSRYYSHRLDECRTWLAIAVAVNFLHANFDAAYAGNHYALAECLNRAQALRDAFDQARQYRLRYPRRARHMMAEVDLGVFWGFEYLGNLELFAKPQASTLSIATTLPNGLASSLEALDWEGQRANNRNRDIGINIVDVRPPLTEHRHRDYALGRREDGTTSPLVEVRDFAMGPPSAVPLPLRVDRGKQSGPPRRDRRKASDDNRRNRERGTPRTRRRHRDEDRDFDPPAPRPTSKRRRASSSRARPARQIDSEPDNYRRRSPPARPRRTNSRRHHDYDTDHHNYEDDAGPKPRHPQPSSTAQSWLGWIRGDEFSSAPAARRRLNEERNPARPTRREDERRRWDRPEEERDAAPRRAPPPPKEPRAARVGGHDYDRRRSYFR
ncbi:hypothetical protein B0T24DRAFT_680180 [Lasiosphaeria ovina]|uniref:Uncharacterized protein n=1 Tax=Lasiosphaeria ovina TaxID=92902 RepID=A0AAE0N6B6_9PEZI|nr:hypothetical protein B0T24DRAFT_680180 [Lasiosphaeria ovina]